MADPHLATPAGRRRARALGIPFEGVPGRLNAITDVPGIEVGYRTLVSGEGPLVVGRGPVRTGVTAIHPRGRDGAGIPVFAGVHSLNGAGEMTGFAWIEEAGRTELPLAITNTHSAGLARDALAKWMVARHPGRMDRWVLPVAAETYDGHLSDINGFHVRDEDVFAALDGAAGGPVEEGSVGGGTGMICYELRAARARPRACCASAGATSTSASSCRRISGGASNSPSPGFRSAAGWPRARRGCPTRARSSRWSRPTCR